MTVNGRTYDFGSVTVEGGGPLPSIESVRYKASVEINRHSDTKGAPLHWSIGEYGDDPVTLEFHKSDAASFLQGVEDKPGGGKLGGRFTFVCSYADTDQPDTSDTVDCLLQSIEDNAQKGRSTMTTVVATQVSPLDYGGVELMPAAAVA